MGRAPGQKDQAVVTKFLASVRDAAEAVGALEGGADMIDVKDPGSGALGAASPQVLQAVREAVGGRAPVSAVTGDLPMEPDHILPAVLARRDADYVKIGFFPADDGAWQRVCDALARDAASVARIAVLFAEDHAPDPAFLDLLAASGFRGVMLDTRRKDGRRLLDHLSPVALEDFVEQARQRGLMSGLAGALEAPDVPRLLGARPDYLGFRGALTDGGRDARLVPERVSRIAALIQPAAVPQAADGKPLDRVYIRDFVQETEIGAYGFERGRRQRVSFSIDAGILPPGHVPEDMAAVLSYDIMMDAVRSVVARGHTDLVETLAEELAARLLREARVVDVVVRVEKLDLGPAAAGVEIRRRRTWHAAVQH